MSTCPLCDETFSDHAAFTAHLATVHDLRDDEGTESQLPESPPPPAPVVPFGDVVEQLGSALPPPMPPVREVPRAYGPPQQVVLRGEAPPSTRVQPFVIAAIAVACVLVFAGVVFEGRGDSKHTLVPVSVTTASDLEGVDLRDVVLQRSDLPQGWTMLQEPDRVSASADPCSTPVDAAHPVFDGSEYEWDLGQGLPAQSVLRSTITQVDDVRTVDKARAYEATPAYVQCFEAAVLAAAEHDAGYVPPSPPDASDPDATTDSDALPPPSVQTHAVTPLPDNVDNAYETVVEVPIADSAAYVFTARVYHLFRGRYAVTVGLAVCACKPFPADDVGKLATSAIDARLELLADD